EQINEQNRELTERRINEQFSRQTNGQTAEEFRAQLNAEISSQGDQEELRLTSESGILQNRSVQRMLNHVRTLSGEEYTRFVTELTESILLQRQEQRERTFLQRRGDSQMQTAAGLPDRAAEGDHDTTGLKRRTRMKSQFRIGQASLSGNPEMTEHILIYERERRRRYGAWAAGFREAYEAGRFRRNELPAGNAALSGNTVLSGGSALSGNAALSGSSVLSGNAGLYPELREKAGGTEEPVRLVPRDRAAGPETAADGSRQEEMRVYSENAAVQNILTQTRIRMQEETTERKAVQEQLDHRLKEVEQQLSHAFRQAGAEENASALADRVKRQLHEELHMERLRRGLY
ncbi:MAG: hypothetical protein LIO75_05885, partial [Lachnospiraceae bacterium]|nr:hypothetical protein [Lachnospiraceae bacterium]